MLILSTALLALPVPLALGAQEGARCCELYPAAKGELVLEASGSDGGSTVEDIAMQYAELTGQKLIYNDETASLMQAQRSGIRGSVRVPAGEVQSFFELLMMSNDYLVHPLRKDEPRLLLIESLRTQARNTVRGMAHWTPEDSLGHFANHPATLVATVVQLPNTDVRQLSNSMRTMIVDANTQQMLPAGNTNSMVLVGFGAQVGELRNFLKRIDAAAGEGVESSELAVISLTHADANDLLRTLQPIVQLPLEVSKEGGPPVAPADAPRLVVDERTNSLVVSAQAKDMARIKALVEQLDRGE